MADLLPETNKQTLTGVASSLSELLQDHKGQDVSVLDLRKYQTWTDFFIIATVSSNTHMDGLERHLKDFCREREIDILGSSRKSEDDQWRLFDLSLTTCNSGGQTGSIIIHLMTSAAREFYELDRLWAPIP